MEIIRHLYNFTIPLNYKEMIITIVVHVGFIHIQKFRYWMFLFYTPMSS